MGAAEYNGVPSQVLSARIDTAASLYGRGAARYVIALGGSRKGDVYSEGEVGKAELMRDSVPKVAAFSSSSGQDTYQSLLAVTPLLRRLDVNKVIIVSDGFHLYRSVAIARSLGLTACGYSDVGSPIQGDLKFDYMLRETVAVTVAQVIGYKEESIIRHGQE
ncbi:YdcF family protein [Ferrimicrobium sp.]|uniref:YdcF family protein n=1 Tax=Ferrimicrobium sp. TaxID=2926050 RepID=UPI00261155D0|nr:YdcF family protein [Ferrimicrobium sp.]